MLITIQATGFGPVGFVVKPESFSSRQMLEKDKRGVELTLHETLQGGRWVGVLRYLTSWGMEREFTRLYEAATLDALAELIRRAATAVLPPGAGFPATPQYETRQFKLAGMLETLTLVALSDVLAQVSKLGNTT